MSSCAKWNDDYSLGIKEIDDQHKKLFGMINKLCSFLDKTSDRPAFINNVLQDNVTEEILDEMTDYASNHFFLEEKYFQEFHYEKMEAHMAQHELFRLKIHSLTNDLLNRKDDVALETLTFLSHWFVEHILHFDREYVDCFHNHGL